MVYDKILYMCTYVYGCGNEIIHATLVHPMEVIKLI